MELLNTISQMDIFDLCDCLEDDSVFKGMQIAVSGHIPSNEVWISNVPSGYCVPERVRLYNFDVVDSDR